MPRSNPLDDDRLTLAGLFFESHTGLRARLERSMARDCGMSVQWFEVLIRLVRSPGERLRMSDLAAQTNLTPSGLTRAIDRLEEAGLVERTACPDDRRGAFARLTPAGRQRILGTVGPHLRHLDENLTGILSVAEREQLGILLRKIRDHVNPGATTISLDS